MREYIVIGQIKFTLEENFDTNIKKFTDIVEAEDYYRTTFSDVAYSISDHGGEFVLTLVLNENGKAETIKRQVLSTTKYTEQHA